MGNTASEGSATSLARSDHQHTVGAGTPVAVGTANNIGTAATFVRSDHVHAGLTRGSADFTTFSEKTIPVGADTILIEDSASSQTKAYATLTNVFTSLNPFGRDYVYTASEGDSTTNNAAFQTKLTYTTGALTGTYRVSYYAEMRVANNNRDVSCRFYNSTDAAEICSSYERITTAATEWNHSNGFQNITFTGSAKTFLIQYASPGGGNVTIRRARIEIYRVS